ncbi:ZIP zinc/iron transport family [Coniochaeta sp. PMI_546]|nr:ZIP zinc/iron transport family [Coniochaeta sp. PMI_546]
MEHIGGLLALRDDDAVDSGVPECEITPNDTSNFNLRIASIFVILVGSALGAIAPIILARSSTMRVPKLTFFIAKYFGSGVIIATAWMHLLSPASEALNNPCLGNVLPAYDWAMGIGLMTVMVMFLIELIVSRFDWGFSGAHSHEHGSTESHGHSHIPHTSQPDDLESKISDKKAPAAQNPGPFSDSRIPGLPDDVSYPPGGQDHLGHQREHVEGVESNTEFAAQMTALFILEFGVIFHSIFIGLTLAISDNFIILFIVLVFHQTFEGLGLGSRLATATWPADRRRWMPYLLGGLYAITTPLAIGIGLGVRQSLQTQGTTMMLINGIFDAISGGILMYTGLVELLAHEFMFNPQMRNAGLGMQLFAYACVATGVALMALLAKWA